MPNDQQNFDKLVRQLHAIQQSIDKINDSIKRTNMNLLPLLEDFRNQRSEDEEVSFNFSLGREYHLEHGHDAFLILVNRHHKSGTWVSNVCRDVRCPMAGEIV